MAKSAAPMENLDEIKDYIRRNIQVDRESLCSVFRLDESAYGRLGRALSEDSDIETVGGRAGGGFRHMSKGARISTDENVSATITRFLREESERAAAHKIADMFTGAELNSLLKDRLRHALRSYKRHVFGRDSNPTKGEVAAALIIQHGSELFRTKEIRDAVARKLKISSVNRWHPGLRSAEEFVKQAGFPLEFSGEPNDDQPPFFMPLSGKRQYPELEAFQQTAKTALLTSIHKKPSRIILQLPTGSGKTRIAVETIREFLTACYKNQDTRNYTVIWSAHQDELCAQAAQTIEEAWKNASEACPVNLIRFYGQASEENLMKASEDEHVRTPTLVVTTPIKALKLVTSADDRIASLAKMTRLMVIDEAHRAAAPTYRQLIDKLPAMVAVVGLTATPYGKVYLSQNSTDELLKIFDSKLIPPESLFEDFDPAQSRNAKHFLLEKNILAKPVVYQIKTGKRIGASYPKVPLSEEDLEKNSEEIDNLIRQDIADSHDRTQSIFRALKNLFRTSGTSILYFAPTVQDALTMTFLLGAEGVPAECVHAETPTSLREKHISNFKRGAIRVLCNVEILTTGFDAPRVTHVVIARPTVSRVLYEQIVGRGLRGPKFGGTDTCVIVDCVDTVPPGNRLKFGYEYFREDWEISEVEDYTG